LLPFLQVASERAQELAGNGLSRCYLVLNGCRDAAERELGEVICHALWRKLGSYPRYLGPVDYDGRRWFHLRHSDSFPALSSGDGPAAQIEELARRILGVDDFDERRPRGEEGEERHAHWLGLSETSQASELRSQYRRLWEGYRRDSAVSQVLLSEGERAELISELERTYRALQMALDERSRPGAPPPVTNEPATPTVASEEEATPNPTQLGPVEHAGQYVSRRRRAQAMSVRELSLRTKIGVRYLEAIEAMDVEALPQPLYVRGYLREIARILALPVDSLLERYLSELAEIKRGSSSGMGVQAGE
jgi:flagellar biosynthesis protein FlhG